MHVRVSGPDGFAPDPAVLARARADRRARPAARRPTSSTRSRPSTGADVVATDTWVSMGKEGEAEERSRAVPALRPRRTRCSRTPRADAIVLHCLPAYRGKEIAADVIDGPQSVVWDEAENRLHAQKALLTWLLAQPGGTP